MSRRKKLLKLAKQLAEPTKCQRTGKVCILDEKQARIQLNRIMVERQRGSYKLGEVDYYRCAYCGFFHLTGDVVIVRDGNSMKGKFT